MKENVLTRSIRQQPLFIELRSNTDNDTVAFRAFESVCEHMHKEKRDVPLFADIWYFETLPYGILKKISRDRKKVKKCLTRTREELFRKKLHTSL